MYIYIDWWQTDGLTIIIYSEKDIKKKQTISHIPKQRNQMDPSMKPKCQEGYQMRSDKNYDRIMKTKTQSRRI